MIGFRIVLIAFIAIWLIGLFACSVSAHDPQHPELNPWFDGLKSGKGPCCSNSDGKVIADADWESHDGHYKVRVPLFERGSDKNAVWVDVPDDAVIKEPNLSGRTMVWPYYNGNGPVIRCFMPGSMT